MIEGTVLSETDNIIELPRRWVHDLNNVLSIIVNYAAFVTEDLGADHPAQNDLKEVVTAAHRAILLVREAVDKRQEEVDD